MVHVSHAIINIILPVLPILSQGIREITFPVLPIMVTILPLSLMIQYCHLVTATPGSNSTPHI